MKTKISLARFVMILAMLVSIHASAQQWQYAAGYGGGVPGFSDAINSICTDASGNIYVTGNFNGSLNFGNGTPTLTATAGGTQTEGFVAKFNAAGLCQWAIDFGGAATDAGGLAIVTDGSNVYVTGSSQFPCTIGASAPIPSVGGSTDGVVFALNAATGATVWARAFGGAVTNDRGQAICMDNAGHVYISGVFATRTANPTAYFGAVGAFPRTVNGNMVQATTDLFVAQLNAATGNFNWVSAGGAASQETPQVIGNDNVSGSGIAFLPAQNQLVIAGSFANATASYFSNGSASPSFTLINAGQADICLLRVDLSGNFISGLAAGGTNADEALAVTYDANTAAAYINGYFNSATVTGAISLTNTSPGFDEVYYARYNPAANTFAWVKSASGSGSGNDISFANDAGATGVYITGRFQSTISFPGVTTPLTAISEGFDDVFLIKVDPATGNATQLATAGSSVSGTDAGLDVDVSTRNDIWVGGIFSDGTTTFTPSSPAVSITAGVDFELFIARYNEIPQIVSSSQTNVTCNGGADGTASVTVNNGLPPYTYSWSPSGGNAATATGLTAGTYTVTVTDDRGDVVSKQFTITQPAETAVTSVLLPANGTYSGSDNLHFVVVYNENVVVNTAAGAPYISIALNTGGAIQASYISGSGTSALTFEYTVAATHQDPDGITVGTLNLNGGTILNSQGCNANNTLNNLPSASGILIQNLIPQTITFNALANKTYGDPDFNPNASAGSGLAVTYSSSNTSVATIVAGQVHIIGAGTTTITASQPGNSNYLPATDVQQSLTVQPKGITVTAAAQSKTYGDADPALTYTNTPALVSGDVFSGTLVRNSGENAGVYVINQGTLALSNNYTLTYNSDNLTIMPKAITVTAVAQSKTYGDADPALTYTNTPALVSGDVFSGALVRNTGENAGVYVINQGTLALSNNYTLTYNSDNLTITPKAVAVTAETKTKVYGDADPALTYTVAPALVTGDGFSGALNRTAGENVGAYAINQGTLALSSNYTLTYNSDNLTITPKAITVTAAAKNKTYGDADPALTYTNTPALVSGDIFTGTLVRNAGENAGVYAINQGTLALSSNYTLAYNGDNLTITPKAITVTATAQSKTYGDADPALTYTNTPALVSGDIFTGALVRNAGENAGVYAITQGTLALSSNYTLTYNGENLTITPKAITVTAVAQSKTYGDADPALTYTNTPALVSGDVFSGALVRNTGENAGVYAINQGTLALSSNYTLAYNGDNLTITPKAITVTAAAKNKTYGDADPVLTYTNSPALVSGDVFSGALSRVAGEQAGSYAIIQNTLALNGNYRLTYVAANLVINKALLTVTANDKTVCLGDAVAPVGVSYTGFKNGDNAAALSREPAVHIPSYNAAGNYALTPGGGTAANYTFNYINGQLTVLPVPSGTIGQTQTGAGVPAGYQLAAPAGTAYTWSTGETSSAITVRASGNYSVKVTNQQGCSRNFTTQVQLQTLSVPNTFSPNGDGINDYWLVPELRNYSNAYVTVVDRDGQVVFESRSFSRWDGRKGGRDLPAGVYFYRINTIIAGTYTGWLNLVR